MREKRARYDIRTAREALYTAIALTWYGKTDDALDMIEQAIQALNMAVEMLEVEG